MVEGDTLEPIVIIQPMLFLFYHKRSCALTYFYYSKAFFLWSSDNNSLVCVCVCVCVCVFVCLCMGWGEGSICTSGRLISLCDPSSSPIQRA